METYRLMKRETGESPVRTRHCKNRVFRIKVTGAFWEGKRKTMTFKSGDLPEKGTSNHEDLVRT